MVRDFLAVESFAFYSLPARAFYSLSVSRGGFLSRSSCFSGGSGRGSMHDFDAFVVGGGSYCASVPQISLSCGVDGGCSGSLLILWHNFVGRSDDGAHGIAVSVVKGVIVVVVVTLRRISDGHVKKFDRFFFFVFWKEGENSGSHRRRH
jgi:hypothetical protein